MNRDSATSKEVGAPEETEIEVTPEMIEAGREEIVSVWLDFTGPSGHEEWGPTLTRVFQAMSAAQR